MPARTRAVDLPLPLAPSPASQVKCEIGHGWLRSFLRPFVCSFVRGVQGDLGRVLAPPINSNSAKACSFSPKGGPANTRKCIYLAVASRRDKREHATDRLRRRRQEFSLPLSESLPIMAPARGGAAGLPSFGLTDRKLHVPPRPTPLAQQTEGNVI